MSIVSRYLNNPSILNAICNTHADAALVRGSLQGSHRFLFFYSLHIVSLLIPILCVASLVAFLYYPFAYEMEF